VLARAAVMNASRSRRKRKHDVETVVIVEFMTLPEMSGSSLRLGGVRFRCFMRMPRFQGSTECVSPSSMNKNERREIRVRVSVL
jgi:hypothetical protein